ncbi:TonB-dependent receptor [Rheinheimera sp.]|uniref:TonB-dependent receptor n=1 Tax=Rheinheimera sp. TaxID=1869214 RepID=UPI00307EDDD4
MTLQKTLVAIAISASLSHPALAEEAASAATAEAEVEVMAVTGKRISYANNTVDEAMKQSKSPIGNVMDLVNQLPGITVGQGDAFGGDDWSTTISMRGFAVSGSEQQLGITVDGLPNGGSSYGGGSKANRYLDTENTALVEVGQGTSDIASASLDALGGTLNFVSINPDDEESLNFGVTGGDHNARRYFSRYNTGELGGHTKAYVSLSDSYSNRWIGTGSNGFTERLHAEAKSVTELGNTKITARFSYDDANEDNYNTVSLAQFAENPHWDRLTNVWTGNPDIDQNFAEVWSTLRENSFSYVKVETDLTDDIQLTVTPYLHLQSGRGDWMPNYQVYVVDAQGNRVTRGTGTGVLRPYTHVDSQNRPILDPAADVSEATRVSSYRHTHYEKQRLGMTSELFWALGNHELRAGAWLEQQERDESRDWHNVIDPVQYHYFDASPYWVQYDRTYDTDTQKLYLQDQIRLSDDLSVTLGVKQFYVDVERQDNIVTANQGQLDSDSDLLPSVGLVYSLTNQIELFAGYTENFKAISDAILETNQDYNALEAETADNIDLGLRYFGDALNFSVTYYDVTFDNRITYLQPGANGGPDYLNELDGTYVNVGGIDSNGIEASMDWQLGSGWSLYGAATLNKAEYNRTVNSQVLDEDGNVVVDANGNPVINPAAIFAGDKVAGSPEKIYNLSLRYQGQAYRTGLTARHTASYFGAAMGGNKDELPASTVLDFYVGYSKTLSNSELFKGLDLALVINNLNDESYLTGGQEGAYFIGAERTASLTLSLDF